MLHNNLKVAFRSLFRGRFFTFLNVSGLAIGLAAAVLLGLWVQDELTFDQFHAQKDRTYKILTNWEFGDTREWIAQTPAPLAVLARENIPQVERCVRQWRLANQTVQVNGQSTEVEEVLLAENGFFQVFDFEFVLGNAQTALSSPNQIVLTASTAREIFGKIPELQAPISIEGKGVFQVGAVVDDLPSNSSIRFNAILPWEVNAEKFARNPQHAFNWGQFNYNSWILLSPGADPNRITQQLSELSAAHLTGEQSLYFCLQKISDIHLYSDFLRWGDYGDLKTVRSVSWIAVLLLLIACMNYINLASAQVASRARMIAVRKTIGASQRQLFGQSMLESALTVGLASTLAIGLVFFTLPYFEDFSGKIFSLQQLQSWETWRLVAVAALAAWCISGIQPALQLSRFHPVLAMKGQTAPKGKAGLRKVLVTLQFVVSIGLGICALVIFNQLQYFKEAKLGFDRTHTFSFFLPKGEKALLLKEKLQQSSGVQGVTLSDNPFIQLGSQCSGDNWEGKSPEQGSELWQINVDSDFPAFFGLELKEGRWFKPGHADSSAFIINESAAKMMQLQSPIGKWMEHGGQRGTIVGVAKDFHFQSLHTAIEPMIFNQFWDSYYVSYIKTRPGELPQAIAATEKVFTEIFPGKIFKYEFLDDQYDSLYKTEARTAQLVGLFTILTLLVSCIGLFGLAAFAAQQRTKEIGVRKVLGASVVGITGLLARDFLQLVFLALVIASPMAYYLMQQWLADFAYRIELQWWMFIGTGIVAILVALFTVGYQSIKAALANPVNSLRSE
jgi:putative ABC transport system permease protein